MHQYSAKTPRFVLRDGNQSIGPRLTRAQSEESTAIYGFSCKQAYDAFLENSDLSLTPYPLVLRNLQDRIAASPDSSGLVVVDATGPQAAYIDAATMASVADALQSRATHLPITCKLMLAKNTEAYEVDPASSESCAAVV